MENKGAYNKTTATGFIQTITKYEAKNCNTCPLKGSCHKSNGNRIIEINHRLNQLRQQATEKLLSEEGIKKRKQRCHEVEPVFANIKNNHGFKRFMLRGKQKVTIETGLLALAHNLRKKSLPKYQKSSLQKLSFSHFKIPPLLQPSKKLNPVKIITIKNNKKTDSFIYL